jgi:DNA-binding transcriptional regulator YhcF (GntR family)
VIRFWLSRNAAIPIYEQLTSQFILGILSRRIAPGEKLPSVRELARRLKIHPNTVSAVYRTLGVEGWVDQRRGSGVFVRPKRSLPIQAGVDTYVRSCFQQGLACGYSAEVLRRAFSKYASPTAENFLVIDPDLELARVLATEIREATGSDVGFVRYPDAEAHLDGPSCVLITERFARKNPELPQTAATLTIQLKSMQDVLHGHERPRVPILLSVVSRSEVVLQWAKTLLSAFGFSPDSLLFRNPQSEGWRDGLLACDLIAADVICAHELKGRENVLEFRIIAEAFLEQLAPALSPGGLMSKGSVGGRNTSS